ncbi:hypothetical protein SFRURICE_017571 [Spodoptera frugiperda]|nr:hypothetical protein SFRURICE_017571 [Spodoptera frugiperda]
MEPTSPWKRPSDVMRLHKMKKRKIALQERMKQPSQPAPEPSSSQKHVDLDFSRILEGDKRKNPFSKNKPQEKKPRLQVDDQLDESNDKTLYALLNLPAKVQEKPVKDVDTEKLSTFSNLLQKFTAEHSVEPVSSLSYGQIPEKKYKYIPIDWALKTKLRLMSPKPFAWTSKLKASEEASGITGFVRCLDTTTSPTLDTSPRARFHQACLYWQHPHLPWLELYPRSSGKVAATSFMATNEDVKQALHREWTESFRSLFQLLRARHCPYFYVCANTFTCLFRAAGVCGVSEPCVLIAPTTRGFRQTLRQEDGKKKLNTSDEDRPKNASFDSCYDTMDDKMSQDAQDKKEDEDDDDPDQLLSQMGFETEVIKKINITQARITHSAESSVDSAAESLVFVRGADAQALFNFLLNCKSIVSPTGPFAGVPPTLLSPTAFHGGTLQSLKVRENTIHSDSNKYYSIELRGPILPTTVHTLFNVLKTSSSAQFSATFAHHQPTLAFSWAARDIAEENEPNHFTKAFNKENLSDCGISEEILQHFCSSDPNVVKPLDCVKYNTEDDTYMW